MEVLLVIVAIAGAWLHGYSRGKRKHSIVEMSARDLHRALSRARK